ncbi:hypothetical protein M3Y98_00019900 [Aphelenchoides besseyi]|nr:hypothetical protein M3Y98_00019900 [Aphelenchoides besseyi]
MFCFLSLVVICLSFTFILANRRYNEELELESLSNGYVVVGTFERPTGHTNREFWLCIDYEANVENKLELMARRFKRASRLQTSIPRGNRQMEEVFEELATNEYPIKKCGGLQKASERPFWLAIRGVWESSTVLALQFINAYETVESKIVWNKTNLGKPYRWTLLIQQQNANVDRVELLGLGKISVPAAISDTMSIQMKLQARAILLEQYKKGVADSQVALKAVLKELGPKSMSKMSSTLWYNRFRKSDFSLGTGATKADQKLIVDSKFLTTKRAFFCEVSAENHFFHITKVTGTNGRFQFFQMSSYPARCYWVLDTFHGRKKQLIFNSSESVSRSHNGAFHADNCDLVNIHFLNGEKCILIFRQPRSYIFSATFDLMTCTMKLEEYRLLDTAYLYSFIADSPSVGMLEFDLKTRTTQYINLKNDLEFDNRVDFGANWLLYYETRRDGMLIGFKEVDWRTGVRSLVTISLTDASVTIRTTNLAEEEHKAFYWPTHVYVWIKDKLFTCASSNDFTKLIYVFDMATMEWKNTGIQLAGQINHMSSSDNSMLIVNMVKSFRYYYEEIYRFPVFEPDSLLNLSWMATRRRAQFEPEFYDRILQKLPTYCHLRCPWQNDE